MLPWKDTRFLLALALAIALHAAALLPFAEKIKIGGKSKISEKPLILALRVEAQVLDAIVENQGLTPQTANSNIAVSVDDSKVTAAKELLRAAERRTDSKTEAVPKVAKEIATSNVESGPKDKAESCVSAADLPTNDDGSVDRRALGQRTLCEQG